MTELLLPKEVRLRLKSQAHHGSAAVLLGSAGLTDAVVKEIDRALNAHGLVKVRAPAGSREERDGLHLDLAQRLGAARIQLIGRWMVMFRPPPAKQAAADANRSNRARPTAAKAPRARGGVPAARPGTAAKRIGAPARRTGTAAPWTGARAARPATAQVRTRAPAKRVDRVDAADARPAPRPPRNNSRPSRGDARPARAGAAPARDAVAARRPGASTAWTNGRPPRKQTRPRRISAADARNGPRTQKPDARPAKIGGPSGRSGASAKRIGAPADWVSGRAPRGSVPEKAATGSAIAGTRRRGQR